MRRKPSIQAPRLEPPTHILATETVAYAAQALDAKLAAQVLDDGAEDGVHIAFAGHFVRFPGREVKVGRHGEGDLVAAEDIRDYGVVAVGGKLVGNAGMG